MATILEQSERLKSLNGTRIVDLLFLGLEKAKEEVISLNKKQLLQGKDYLGNPVGEYAKDTQSYATNDGISTKKPVGEPYNFNWFGNFYEGFKLSINGDVATIYSDGVGSGGKKEFLTTNDLFGLNDDDLKKVIKDKLLPFVLQNVRKTLHV